MSGTADLLESRCKELMTKGMSVFTRCYETLKTGDIHMDDLDLVLENKEKFQEMCTIIIESETKAAGDEKKDASRLLEEVNLILKWRKHEVEAFKQLHVLSSTLLNCCKQIIPGKLLCSLYLRITNTYFHCKCNHVHIFKYK